MHDLTTMRCRPMRGEAPMTEAQIAEHLGAVEGWTVSEGTLSRRFAFPDFHRTMAFVNAVAWIAQQQDHGPDLAVSWVSCEVRFTTHDVGGVSINDFICAARINALFA
jgi:4a-hydroxytetrahydrobiopterin dehydratase